MQSLDEWLDYIAGQHWQDIDMGLQRMRTMVARLDLLRPAAHVITVAGTNGKGSTCVACEALLQKQGKRTGVTLSPHVTRFNERIRIDGQEASDALIMQALRAVEDARQNTPLTYFEFSALAALWCFKHCAVDVAVLEIGLGGRLDAFNVVDADVAVITSIGLDHEAFLGNDRDSIGREKAGILRADQHVVLGVDMPGSVHERCSQLNLHPLVVDTVFDVGAPDPDHWRVRVRSAAPANFAGGQAAREAVLPYGQCAPHNLLLAYLAVCTERTVPLGWLAEVSQTIRLPGRMQEVALAGRRWLLDVAHNPAGAAFLVQQLRARQLVPAVIVCGMLQDKRHREVYSAISAAFDATWFCLSTAGERGMRGADLASALGGRGLQVCEDWSSLLAQVNSATAPGSVILAFGSFNLVEQFHLIDKSVQIEP